MGYDDTMDGSDQDPTRTPYTSHLDLGCLAVMAMIFLTPLALGQDQPVAPQSNQPSSSIGPISKPSGEVTPLGVPVTSGSSASGSTGAQVMTSSSSAGSATASASGDYVLQSGDTIEMTVYHEPDLSIRSKIGKDGMVQFPLLGEVKLGGFTVRAASTLIKQRYNADYVVEPQIYLDVAAYNPRKFTIIGQVGRPGAYDFSGSEPLGLLEAIGMAGGFTRIADRGHVLVKRREGDTISTLKVNAKKLSDTGTDRFELKPGDVINVGESWY